MIEFPDTTINEVIINADASTVLNIQYQMPFCEYGDWQDEWINRECPICKSRDQTIPIAYGLPSKEMIQEAKEGKLRIGGCYTSGCIPHWYCKKDTIEF